MVIEHVAMFVKDLEGARDFFVQFLGGRSNDGYHNAETGFRSYFVSFDDGARIEIMNSPYMIDGGKKLDRIGYEHIAFSVGSKEKVDELTEKIDVYRKAYYINAIDPSEYEDYGPVVLFRSSFEEAWGNALKLIADMRKNG